MRNAATQARRPTYVVTFFPRYELSSLPGIASKTRIDALVTRQSMFFRRRMDARVEPAHDDREIASSHIHVPHQPAKRRHRRERAKRHLVPTDPAATYHQH